MEFDALTGWRHLPNSTYTAHFGNRSGKWEFDKYGFVKVSDHESAKYTITIFGGSCVWGVGATSGRNSIPGFIQRKLGNDYKVYNCGRRMNFSLQEYIMYLANVRWQLKPDVVISINGFNDFYYFCQSGFPNYFRTPYLCQLEQKVNNPMKEWVWEMMKFRRSDKLVRSDIDMLAPQYINEAVANYCDIMRIFKNSCTNFIWVLQPSRALGYTSWTELAHNNADLDLGTSAMPIQNYFDACHYNDAGNEFIADRIISHEYSRCQLFLS